MVKTRLSDPAIYLALLVPLLALGFWPNYLSKLSDARLGIHLHGGTAFAWVLLLVAQARFAAIGRLSLHRKVGKAGFVVGPAVIITACFVCREMLRRGGGSVSDGVLLTAVLPVGGLVIFSGAWAAALLWRHKPELHKRWMILTALALMGAGVDRLFLFFVPGFGDEAVAAHANFVVAEVVCLMLIGNDARLGQIRAPFVVALGAFTANHLLLVYSAQWRWWRAVAEAVAS